MSPSEHEVLADQILAMVRDEQRLISEGRLEEVVAAMAERQARMAELPQPPLPEGPLKERLREIHAEGDRTLTLLCALRDELAGMLAKGKSEHHAALSYAESSRL